MNVAIEAKAVGMSGGGVKTYVVNLVHGLLESGRMKATLFYDSPLSLGTFPGAEEEALPLWHKAFLRFWLARQMSGRLKDINPDVVHYTKADVPGRLMWPSVVTIYDVIPLLLPKTQAIGPRLYWPGALKRAAGAHHILTISETSKNDIMRLLGVSSEKITVTPLAPDTARFHKNIPQPEIARARQQLRLSSPYILFVATRDMRKNVSALVRAFASISNSIPHYLVLAGKAALKTDASREIVSRLPAGIRNKILFVDFVSDALLPPLYAGADMFVWPSIYEGWAFPVQEAMACGVPVIVSNGGALPEVVGQAGLVIPFSTAVLRDRLADDGFERKLADSMGRLAHNTRLRLALKQSGFERVKRFSWDSVIQKTLDVYEKVASI
ncbi:MAG: glycosyltransferase family 4 protein [Candidatus Andersenbacteria bacterium]|nr:glycosyltransferase family 4 protein [Candidatus Andersenbacteria bacterium]